MDDRRAPGEHRDPLAQSGRSVVPRPAAGPIAILPEPTELMSSAVVEGGGEVAPLSDATAGVVWLGKSPEELAAVLRDHPSVGWVQLPLAGVEAWGAVLSEFAHVTWTSAKGSFAEPVAEHAVALTLATLRQIPDKSRSDSWAQVKHGVSLYGRSVVIIGAGGIAVELIRLLAPFEVDITIVRRSSDPLPGANRTVTSAELADVLPTADVVIVAAAATDETAQLLGATELALLQPTAVLVNIARGRLVDTDALVTALSEHRLWGAGLDVTDPEPLPDGHPLWSAPGVVITSHCADTPEMTVPLLAERVRLNVEALTGSGKFVGLVDPHSGY